MKDVAALIKSLSNKTWWERKDAYAAIARDHGEGFANVVRQSVEAKVATETKERSQ